MASKAAAPASSADVVQNSKNAKKAEMDRANQLAQSAEHALNQFRNLNKALSVISEAIAVRPKQARWYTIRAQIYRALGKNQLAFYDYNAALRLEPRSYFNYIGRGLCLRKLRRYNEALLDIETALEAEPGNPCFRYFRATVHQHLEDYNSAVADYGAALGVPGYSLRARVSRACCLELLGRVSEALVDMEVAVGRGDGSPHAAPFTAYGLLLMQLGRHAEAVVAFSAAVERAGQSPAAYATALDNRAWALYCCGRLKEAQEDLYSAAAALGGDTPVNDPSPPFHRGAVALAGKNPVKALPELLRAAEYVEGQVRKARRRALGQTLGGQGGGPGEEDTEGEGTGRAEEGDATGLAPTPAYPHPAYAPSGAAAGAASPSPSPSPSPTPGGPSSPTRPGRRAEGLMPAGSHLVAVELAFAQDGEGMPPELRPQGRERHSAAAVAAHAAHVAFPHDEDTDSDTYSDAVRERDTALQEPVRHRRGGGSGEAGEGGAQGLGGTAGAGEEGYGADGTISDSVSLPSGSMAASSIGGRSGGGGLTRRGNIARNLGKASNKVPAPSSSAPAPAPAPDGSATTSSAPARERAKRPWELVPSWIRERVWPEVPAPFTPPASRAAAMVAAQVQAYLGLAYLHLGHAERALHHFNAALACWEGCIPARYHAGLCLLSLGRHGEAEAQLCRVLADTEGVAGEVEVLQPGAQGRQRGGGGKKKGGGGAGGYPSSPRSSPTSPRGTGTGAGFVPELRLHGLGAGHGAAAADADSEAGATSARSVLPSDPSHSRAAVIRLGIASVSLIPPPPPPSLPPSPPSQAEEVPVSTTVRSTGTAGGGSSSAPGVLSAAMARAAAEHAHMHAHAAKRGLSAVLLARALARQAQGKHTEAAIDFDGSLGLQAELAAAALAAASAAAHAHAHAHGAPGAAAAGSEEDLGPALLCRARTQLALRRVKAALRDAEEAIGSGVTIAPAYDIQGQALAYMGQHEQAAHAFGLALKALQHGHDSGAEGAAKASTAGSTPSSTARSLAAGGLKQEAADYLSRRAEAHRCVGEAGEAILDLNQALELRPGDAVLLEQRAHAHYEHGDARAAAADYASALAALDPAAAGTPSHATRAQGAAGGGRKAGQKGTAAALRAAAAVRARLHYSAAVVHASQDGWEAAAHACTAGLEELTALLGDPKYAARLQQEGQGGPGEGGEADDEADGAGRGGGDGVGKGGKGKGRRSSGTALGGLSSGLAAALASAALRIGGPSSSSQPTRLSSAYGGGYGSVTGVSETPQSLGDTPLPNRYGVPPAAVPVLLSGRVGAALKNLGTSASSGGGGVGGEAPPTPSKGVRERLSAWGREAQVGALMGGGDADGNSNSGKAKYLQRLHAFNKCGPEPLVRLRIALQHERAKALQHVGRHEEAAQDFTDVLCSCPGNPHALLRRAISYAALGEWRAAAADVEACKVLRPGDPRFELNYGALRGVEGILLCGPGEEPQWPVLGLEEVAAGGGGHLPQQGGGDGAEEGVAGAGSGAHALLLSLRAQPKPPLPVLAPNSTGLLHPFAL